MSPRRAFLSSARAVGAVERTVLAVLVAGMVLLSAAQVLMRNVWHTGWPWVEPLMGMALLWMAMLGALAATGRGRHIAIDLASALLPRALAAQAARVSSVAAAVVCGILAYASWRYVSFLADMETNPLLGIPQWKYYGVIPAAFGLMALRFAVRAFVPAAWLAEDAAADAGRGA